MKKPNFYELKTFKNLVFDQILVRVYCAEIVPNISDYIHSLAKTVLQNAKVPFIATHFGSQTGSPTILVVKLCW